MKVDFPTPVIPMTAMTISDGLVILVSITRLGKEEHD
jgi:hypothetical protein